MRLLWWCCCIAAPVKVPWRQGRLSVGRECLETSINHDDRCLSGWSASIINFPYSWTSGRLKSNNNNECSFLGEIIQEGKSDPVLVQIDAVGCGAVLCVRLLVGDETRRDSRQRLIQSLPFFFALTPNRRGFRSSSLPSVFSPFQIYGMQVRSARSCITVRYDCRIGAMQ